MSEEGEVVKTSQPCVACGINIEGTIRKTKNGSHFSPFPGSGKGVSIDDEDQPICYACYAEKILQDDFLSQLFRIRINLAMNTVFICPIYNQKSSFRVEYSTGEYTEEYCVFTLEGWIVELRNKLDTRNQEDKYYTFECISCKMKFKTKKGIYDHFQLLICNTYEID